jgi:prevent-host-death family protein
MEDWTTAEAKAKLSEVIERAMRGEPQTITRNGKTAVVVVSAAEWQRRVERKGTLADFLQRSPLAGSDLEIGRMKGKLRDAGIE